MFPGLPAPINAAGAAAGAASSAASVFNAIQAAANQEAERRARLAAQKEAAAARDVQQDFTNSLKLQSKGYVEDNSGTIDPITGHPTVLLAPNATAPQTASGQKITDRNGQVWRQKTPAEKDREALNETNSYTAPAGSDQEKYLQGMGVQPNTPIPFQHLPQITGLQKSIQEASDAADKKQQVVHVTQQASDRAKAAGFDLPVGTTVPLNLFKELNDTLQPKDKPDVSQMIPGLQGPNGGMLIYDKNTQTTKEIPFPTGSKPVLNANQTEMSNDRKSREAIARADRAERTGERRAAIDEKSKATFRGFETTKQKAIDKANQTYRKAMTDAIGSPELQKQALEDLRSDLENAQSEYRRNIQGETGSDPGENDWPAEHVRSLTPESPGRGGKKDPAGIRQKQSDPLGIR